MIYLLRLPPISATLAASLIHQPLAIWSNRGLRIKPPADLADFGTGRTTGIPNVALIALVLSVVVWIVLERSVIGRWLLGSGQNLRAARLAGIPTQLVRAVTYTSVAVLAAVADYLLRRRFAEHGAGIPARFDCRRRDRRNLHCGWQFQCSRHMGRVIVSVPGRVHAEFLRPGGRVRMLLTSLIIIGIVIAASTRRDRA